MVSRTTGTPGTAGKTARSFPQLAQLYPFEGRRLEIGGHQIHTLDEGEGEAVVMVHGNPTWSFYYRNVVLALRDRYRCIAPDHIGCGLSDQPTLEEYPYTLERRVDDLEALLQKLDVTRKITLVLHDWGGMIGMAYAARHPERIARLVFLNTAAFPLPPSKKLPPSLRLTRSPLGPFLVQGLNLFCRGAVRSCVRQPLAEAVRRGYLDPHDSWAHRLGVLRFVQDIPLSPEDPGYDIVQGAADALPRFADVPTKIFWGDHDFVFDDDFLEEWRERVPHADIERFADAGHWVLEDAGEQIIASLEKFLVENPLP